MKLPILFTTFKSDIKKIENEFELFNKSDSDVIKETAKHLLQSGGKRIRPIFMLLTAKFGQYDIENIKFPAAALELIHSASLAHDDVIDDSELRRGIQTVGAKWDNKVATYTGDYIFAHALKLMSHVNNPLAHQILADTMVNVCLGEIDQIKDKYHFEQTFETYYKRIERKTAILIAASGQLGAITAGVSQKIHQQLYDFGYYVGMSFQIMDDILDFTGTSKTLGKPAGSDLASGNITLPTLFAMEIPHLKKKICQIHDQTDQEELQAIVKEIRQSGAIKMAYQKSNEFLQKAYEILENLPKSKHRKPLFEIANYVGARKY